MLFTKELFMNKTFILFFIYLAISSISCGGECTHQNSVSCEGITSADFFLCDDSDACNYYDSEMGECEYEYSIEACLYGDECD